jgi:hypothetical protein
MLVGQQPKKDTPFEAPVELTITPVLQNPLSQKTLVDSATRVPAEHEEKKLHGSLAAQHWAREPLRERVAGKSQVRRSATTKGVMSCQYYVSQR